MNRAGVLSIVLAAAVTGACGGADGAGSSPTGPSQTTTTTSSQPAPPAPQPSCMPSAPTGLAVSAIQGTAVSLTWNGVSGATQYIILVGSSPSSSDEISTNTTQTNYTSTMKVGRHYARVQAKGSCGTSGSSNEVEFNVG